MKLLRRIKSVLCNLHFLLFANGFLISSILFCFAQNDYENRLFNTAARSVNHMQSNTAQDTQVINALHATYNLLNKRAAIFSGSTTGGFVDEIIHPVSDDLMTGKGACGSYAATLCRLLNAMGFNTRFAQMKVNGMPGGHIIAEAQTKDGWVVLDPLYNLCFKRPDGRLASYADVSDNWSWYKSQVPAGYDPDYRYEGVQYTNWNKIPVVMPMVKKSLSLLWRNDELEHFSLRNYFLRKYEVFANLLLIMALPLNIVLIRKFFALKWKRTLQMQLPRLLLLRQG